MDVKTFLLIFGVCLWLYLYGSLRRSAGVRRSQAVKGNTYIREVSTGIPDKPSMVHLERVLYSGSTEVFKTWMRGVWYWGVREQHGLTHEDAVEFVNSDDMVELLETLRPVVKYV